MHALDMVHLAAIVCGRNMHRGSKSPRWWLWLRWSMLVTCIVAPMLYHDDPDIVVVAPMVDVRNMHRGKGTGGEGGSEGCE